MKYLILIILILFKNFAFGISPEKIESIYRRNNQYTQIYCEYLPQTSEKLHVKSIGELFHSNDSIEQAFTLSNGIKKQNFKINIYADYISEKAKYRLTFQNGYQLTGEVLQDSGRYHKKEIKLSIPTDQSLASFQLDKMTCFVEFAIAKAFDIKDSDIHISVHPHRVYDYLGLLTSKIEKYLSFTNENLILLEDGNYKENLIDLNSYLKSKIVNLPINNYKGVDLKINDDVNFVVSPAGHNRYNFLASDRVTVTYTGGNHNYCIWNNTRRLIEALINSQNTKELEIIYDADATVMQCGRGIINGLGVSCWSLRKGNLLKDFLEKGSKNVVKYHNGYYSYFANTYFERFKNKFSKVYFDYQSKNFSSSKVILGSGVKELRISIRYKY